MSPVDHSVGLRQAFHRVGRDRTVSHLKVQMSSVRRAGVSHYAYLLSLEHLVADRHLELLHVGVERHKVAVVLYAHVIAVGRRKARPDDLSAVRRVDGRSLVVRDIYSEVEIIRTVKIASLRFV